MAERLREDGSGMIPAPELVKEAHIERLIPEEAEFRKEGETRVHNAEARTDPGMTPTRTGAGEADERSGPE